MNTKHSLISASLLLCLSLGTSKHSEAAPAPAFTSQGGVTIADVTEKTIDSVVNISATRVVQQKQFGMSLFDFFGNGQRQPQPRERKAQSLGSGVVVSNDGIIVTNNHVVENADGIQVVFHDGSEINAKVVGTDPLSDLAVLKLEKKVKGLKAISYGNSESLRLGEVVVAIGNPFGVGQTVTMGIVSAKGRTLKSPNKYEDFIQTDAAINPGNSGGALVNMNGELIGINTAILSRSGGSQGIGFAIPTTMVEPIVSNLLKDGKVKRGYLGVGIQDLTKELATGLGLKDKKGALVSDVVAGGAGEKAGLKQGDLVTALNNKRVRSSTAFRNRIASLGPNKIARMSVIRNGKNRIVTARLDQRPTDALASANQPGKQPKQKSTKGKGLFKGVQVTALTDKMRQNKKIPKTLKGVVVTAVDPTESFGRINLRPGDVIVEINRQAIKSVNDFKKFGNKTKNSIAVLVWRNGMTIYQSLSR